MKIKVFVHSWEEDENKTVWKGESNQLDLVLEGLLEANERLMIEKDKE